MENLILGMVAYNLHRTVHIEPNVFFFFLIEMTIIVFKILNCRDHIPIANALWRVDLVPLLPFKDEYNWS